MNLNVCKYGLIMLVLMIGVGCEKPVTVDIPAHEREIVTRALVSPDSLWRVAVSSSVGFQDNTEPFPITNAVVEIKEGDVLVETLQHTAYGVFTSQQAKPIPGRIYSLHVSASGYSAVSSTIVIPETVSPPQVTIDEATSENDGPYLNVAVTIDDAPQKRNYYAMDVVLIQKYEENGVQRQMQYPHFFETSDVILLGFSELDGEVETYNVRYFQDDLFDGTSETINIRVQDPGFYFLEQEDSYAVVLRFYETDESYFRFFKTAELQWENEDNPFGEPVRIFSNMSNGFGIFAGYQVHATTLVSSIP